MEGKKVLITGASGQIGRGLVHVLHKKNEVHAVARFGKKGMLEEVEKKAAKVWRMDMGVDNPSELPTDFDAVLHMAVNWGGDDTVEEQNKSYHLSCSFVGDLMQKNEKAVFVLGSTGSVYQAVEGGCKEDETPVYGGSSYVTAKIAMTHLSKWISERSGRKVAELRFWYPYAPYVPHQKVDRFLTGSIFGNNPRSVHQRTYIKHHVEKTILAAEQASSPPQILNCATDEGLTLGELARIGAKITGSKLSDKAKLPGQEPGPGHVADTTKMVKLLGPTPVKTEEGFRRYLRAREENITWPEDWMFE